MPFPEVDTDKRIIHLSSLPRRLRRTNQNEDSPIIQGYLTTFQSITSRLLSSRGELVREVQANASPLRHFISISSLALNTPKRTEWTEERLRESLHKAWQIQLLSDHLEREFLCDRNDLSDIEYTWTWKMYQENREDRHYWDQVLRCNYDWAFVLSGCLKRLFKRPETEDSFVKLSVAPDNSRWFLKSPRDCVPETFTVEYRTTTGDVKYRAYHASPSVENLTTESRTSDLIAPSLRLGGSNSGSPSSDSKSFYVNVLEYREINRHARRKIEMWLRDGWRIFWKWNGKYKGELEHRMTLKRTKANHSPYPSRKKTKYGLLLQTFGNGGRGCYTASHASPPPWLKEW